MGEDKKLVWTSNTYEVGHGKPPKSKRFQPGKSGNPRGRPPNDERALTHRQARRDVLEEMERKVAVEGRQEPMIVVVVRQLLVLAAKGNLRAIELVLRLRESAVNEQARDNPLLYDRLRSAEAHLLSQPEPPSPETRKHLNAMRRKTRRV